VEVCSNRRRLMLLVRPKHSTAFLSKHEKQGNRRISWSGVFAGCFLDNHEIQDWFMKNSE
jgi:hypothetical protein